MTTISSLVRYSVVRWMAFPKTLNRKCSYNKEQSRNHFKKENFYDKDKVQECTWMSLWMWRLTSSWEGTSIPSFNSSRAITLWALPMAVAASSQTLESTLLFTLSLPRAPFGQGVISSMEAVGEAALASEAMGVDAVVSTTSFATLECFWARLDRGSFFLALSLAYNSWLNLVVNSAKDHREQDVSNKVGKRRTRMLNNKHLLFSSLLLHARRRGKVWDPRNDEPTS